MRIAAAFSALALVGLFFYRDALIPPKVNGETFKDYVVCGYSEDMRRYTDYLRKKVKPGRKDKGVWFYDFDGSILGLPATSLALGVCGEDGDNSCGWGSYLAFRIPLPLAETRARLKKTYGEDFTVEKRSEEVEATLRPVLGASRKNSSESWLECDPGSL